MYDDPLPSRNARCVKARPCAILEPLVRMQFVDWTFLLGGLVNDVARPALDDRMEMNVHRGSGFL